MKNKIFFIIFLFILCINVKALTCEYKVDKNNVGLIITVTSSDPSPSIQLSGGVYLMPGTTNPAGSLADLRHTSNCPLKVYYSCNSSRSCKLDANYFSPDPNGIYGVLELRGSSGGQGDPSGSGDPSGGGHATVSSVIHDFQDGNSCGALKGLNDLIETYVKMPLLIVALVIFLVMTTLEYSKVVFSGDGSSKKANENTIKRALAMVILGLSPMIIQLLITLAQIPMSC